MLKCEAWGGPNQSAFRTNTSTPRRHLARLVGKGLRVRHVPEITHAEAVRVDALRAAPGPDRSCAPATRTARPASKGCRRTLGFELPVGRLVGVVEDVVEVPLQRGAVLGRHVGVHVASAHREDAHVVDAVDVVRVDVGEPDRIHRVHLRREELESKLGRRVDEQASPVQLQEGPVTGPPVPGIVRRAGRAVAPDDGHPERRAGAEEGELHGGARGARAASCWSCPTRGRESRP